MALTMHDADEYRAIRQDATPSMSEMVAEWAGVPLSEVTESDHERWLDWLRDCEEARGWQ